MNGDLSFMDDELRKRGVDPLQAASLLSFMQPTSFAQLKPEQTAAAQPAASAQSALSFTNGQAAKPAQKPGQLSFADRYSAEQANAPAAPKKAPFGWTRLAKALGVGALGGGRAGMAEYERPNVEAQQKFEQETKQHEQRLEGIKEEAGLENTQSQIAERDARTAALNDKLEKPEDVVHAYSEALASGDTKRAEELKPKVQEYLTTTQKPAGPGKENDKKIDEFVDENNNRVNVMQRTDGTTYNVVRGKERAAGAGGAPGSTQNDPKDIAAAIIRGEQPPDLKGLYRSNAAVRAELARRGFNLTKAEEDWQATQKYLATLNGSQQTRLRQAVDATKGYLQQVQDIYSQWQKVGAASGWKDFNKASLATAKHLPGQAGELATRLEARIADLTSELGTVYKGGNSSTDESLKLAAKNLSGDWNERTFNGAVGDILESIRYRENSLKLPVAGVSQGNAYTPPALNGPAPSVGGLPPGWKP